MNGLDKITARIAQDGQKEIDGVLEKARAEAAGIAAEYAAKGKAEAQKILERGRQSAKQREERLESAAQLEGRKAVLAAKQEMLDEAFERARQKLLELPEERYVSLLADLAVKASATGREKLIFSPSDRARVGKAVVLAANEKLAKNAVPDVPGKAPKGRAGAALKAAATAMGAIAKGTAMLTVAEETRPIDGGFILSSGSVEVNCTFDTLVRLQRSELSAQVAKVLFE